MTTYIAFLRGINVGGHNRMKMESLRTLFGSLGYEDIETYIQSGNVVFTAEDTDEATLRVAIHDSIEAEFDYDVSVMIRTRTELEEVVAAQPFEFVETTGINHYVTFLHERPTDEQIKGLLAGQSDAERFEVIGREVYSELDKDRLGNGRFTDVGMKLGLEATRRNWDVVKAVRDMA